jgi:hypothetical protein
METIMERMKTHTVPPQMASGKASPTQRARARKRKAEATESPVYPRAGDLMPRYSG